MPQFLISIHHPDDYNAAAVEDAAMEKAIDDLNEEMVQAGVRRVVGGLGPLSGTRSLRVRPSGEVLVTDGPYLETREHVGGFWILEVGDLEEAMAWGRKAVVACRAPVEVRGFFGASGEQARERSLSSMAEHVQELKRLAKGEPVEETA